MKKNGHPVAAERTELTYFLIDVGTIIVTFEHPASLTFGHTDLSGQSDQRVRVVENLSLDQLRPKDTLVQLCTESVHFWPGAPGGARRRCSRGCSSQSRSPNPRRWRGP
jgi:hypothetical protein